MYCKHPWGVEIKSFVSSDWNPQLLPQPLPCVPHGFQHYRCKNSVTLGPLLSEGFSLEQWKRNQRTSAYVTERHTKKNKAGKGGRDCGRGYLRGSNLRRLLGGGDVWVENRLAVREGIRGGSKKRAFQMEGTANASVLRWEDAGLVRGAAKDRCDWSGSGGLMM